MLRFCLFIGFKISKICLLFVSQYAALKRPLDGPHIVNPMNLTMIHLKRDSYASFAAFMADVKWIRHNCRILFHGRMTTHNLLPSSFIDLALALNLNKSLALNNPFLKSTNFHFRSARCGTCGREINKISGK